ncbi:MAG: hypothetical protein HAW67_01275 [Endozoicomonadaceae bacterium]|nr:hypothetical protein [Endozoicomonadaceae bacterium]
MNRKYLITLLGLVVVAVFAYHFFEIGKTSIVLWEQKKIDVENKVQITKVSIFSESCNRIIFEISYSNVKNAKNATYKLRMAHTEANSGYRVKEDGTLDYSLWVSPPGDDGLRSDPAISLSNGSGSVKYSNWITPDTLSTETKRFWLQIDTYTDNGEQDNYFDHLEIKRKKVWNNTCN